MFDPEQRPTDFTREIMNELNALIARLQSRKVAEIVLPEPPIGLRVPNLVRAFLQAHLRRCLMFLEGGVAEVEAGRPLVAELCTRSLYESIAVICDYADKLKPLVEGGDYDGIERMTRNAAFATRIPSFLQRSGDEVKAPQIMNQIDRMEKRSAKFREAYDHLSDIVHPNGLGALAYFATIGDGRVVFLEGGNEPERARDSLLVGAILLAHVEIALLQIEAWLVALNVVLSAMHSTPSGSSEAP